ncbi:MAG: DUF305 domain-containing protein [Ignavibacteria bacterium]|nr:DUF305 domain-containing protein [Ignavibacteria bacterium]
MCNINYLSAVFIVFLSMLILSSCKKDTDMKDSTTKDRSMKDNYADTMQKNMDKNMSSNKNDMMDNQMSNMINKMNDMKMSGNTDIDFVNMMIIHHQSAIDMSNSEVSSGKNESIIKMANNIIKDQQKEIEIMQKWLDKNKDYKKDASTEGGMKLMMSMKAMMEPDMKMSGNTDKDFTSMMILHHKGAIDMSEVELQYGTDPEIKKMAQDIIEKQKAEIKQMEDWK